MVPWDPRLFKLAKLASVVFRESLRPISAFYVGGIHQEPLSRPQVSVFSTS